MALCSKARELLTELSRSDWIPPYNEELVRQIGEEINAFHEQIMEKLGEFGDAITDDSAAQCSLIVNHQCLLRNKRCILAYLHQRADKIQALRWEIGSIIPEALSSNLSQRELQFFHGYDQLVTNYMADLELDLTSDMHPPKELFVEVRVLQDCGEIVTENGVINLEANSTHFVRRTDVEQLLRQGFLKQIQ